jgi:S-adenosylmethionine hydrolase
MIYARDKHKVRLISNDRYFRKPVSQTFHGRDIFAPVAAHLAAGVPPSRIGKLLQDYLRPPLEEPQRTGKRTWTGRILKIDRFGSLITNFHVSQFPDLESKNFSMALGTEQVGVMAHNYAECGPGELFVIAGSSGYLEVSVGQGSAAKAVGCAAGAPVELTLR